MAFVCLPSAVISLLLCCVSLLQCPSVDVVGLLLPGIYRSVRVLIIGFVYWSGCQVVAFPTGDEYHPMLVANSPGHTTVAYYYRAALWKISHYRHLVDSLSCACPLLPGSVSLQSWLTSLPITVSLSIIGLPLMFLTWSIRRCLCVVLPGRCIWNSVVYLLTSTFVVPLLLGACLSVTFCWLQPGPVRISPPSLFGRCR